MGAIRIEEFREAMKGAAASLRDAPGRDIALVHHNDTDGITSGAILRKSLMRAGFAVENIPVERVHPSFLPAIHIPGRRLILYADLGGQAADVISRHIPEDSRVIVIGEHEPRVDDDHVVAELEHGHVLADAVEPAERDDAKAILL